LCKHDKVSTPSLVSQDKRILGYIGTIRRGLHHSNSVNGKNFDISESALRAEWKSVDAIKQQEQKPLRRDLRNLFKEQINLLLKNLRDEVGIKGFRKIGC
jgi:hypothetical protein